jgi:hypothetical protein
MPCPAPRLELPDGSLRRLKAFLVRFVCLTAVLIAFVAGGPPETTLFWNYLFDAGHAVIFAIVMWLSVGIAQAFFPTAPQVLRVGGALTVTLAIGLVTEFVQAFDPNRDASLGDFLRDLAGATIFLLVWIPNVKRDLSSGWSKTMRFSALLIALLVTAPFVVLERLYLQRDRSFPTLVRFDASGWENKFLTIRDATLTPNSIQAADQRPEARGLALLDLRPGRYPGFALDEPYPDWRDFKWLVFTTFSGADEPIEFTLRVHDRNHNGKFNDRFNRQIVIHPGPNRIAIVLDDIRSGPVSRPMDLSEIRGLAVFAYQLKRPASVYLGAFHLE